MTLALDVQVVARDLAVQLTVPTGQTCAVLGPNGAGKSTLLDLTAGLLRPDSGTIELAGRRLVGPDTWVPPHRRRVVLLSAQPRLFPHLSVLANVAFGPRNMGFAEAEVKARVERALDAVDLAGVARSWLARVGADQWADRPVTTLSTGQAQRIALARALAVEPELLLLDEPFAALDVGVAAAMRMIVAEVLADRTAIMVTHEVLDVAVLADIAVVLDHGSVVESGPAERVLRRPSSPFAADLGDVNLLRGVAATADTIEVPDLGSVRGMVDHPLEIGGPALALFPPAAVSVYRHPPDGSPRNRFFGTVEGLEPHGALVRIRVGPVIADVTADSVRTLHLRLGAEVHLAVKAAEVAVYPG